MLCLDGTQSDSLDGSNNLVKLRPRLCLEAADRGNDTFVGGKMGHAQNGSPTSDSDLGVAQAFDVVENAFVGPEKAAAGWGRGYAFREDNPVVPVGLNTSDDPAMAGEQYSTVTNTAHRRWSPDSDGGLAIPGHEEPGRLDYACYTATACVDTPKGRLCVTSTVCHCDTRLKGGTYACPVFRKSVLDTGRGTWSIIAMAGGRVDGRGPNGTRRSGYQKSTYRGCCDRVRAELRSHAARARALLR